MPHIVASLTCLASACAAIYVTTCRALPLYECIRSAKTDLNTSLLVSSSTPTVDFDNEEGEEENNDPTVCPSRFATGAWVTTA